MTKSTTILHFNNSWTMFLALVAPLFSDPVPKLGPLRLRPQPGQVPAPRPFHYQPGCGRCPPPGRERQHPYPKATDFSRIQLFPGEKEWRENDERQNGDREHRQDRGTRQASTEVR